MPHRQDTKLSTTHLESCSSLSVQRAVNELRSGRSVCVVTIEGQRCLVMAAESIDDASFRAFQDLCVGPLQLAITQVRAKALGYPCPDTSPVVCLNFTQEVSVETLQQITDPLLNVSAQQLKQFQPQEISQQSPQSAAVGLVKISRLLPSALVGCIDCAQGGDVSAWASQHNILLVKAEDVFQSEYCTAETLQRVSEAPVPLEDAEQARVIAYRPKDGGLEHLAIVIGDPFHQDIAPLVRIHSQCFTGDLLGSLRCDCGDQLRGAIQAIAQDGGGVLLYLAQEGRGIGLPNKLRAYVLQDRGLDTLEANEHLGFDADERVYLPAAQMLRDLGLSKIRLLTNNPGKISGLTDANIDVVDRVGHAFPSNQHNEQYLLTKKTKGGHLF
jgi:GTP cyclohydrolase II